MGRLFGTDGIRGTVDEYPMTTDIARKVGQAVARHVSYHQPDADIIIGRDTRISGGRFEEAVAAGVASMGMDARLAGVIPTPGIAFLTVSRKAGAGIVVSASHNPYHDNGIKLFNGAGYKFPEEDEAEIEAWVLPDTDGSRRHALRSGSMTALPDAHRAYASFLKSSLETERPLRGMRIVLDCANGATHRIAPPVFSDLGADVNVIFDRPDGRNINDNCGSQHTGALSREVVGKRADMGLAFDGDGDRLIAVDEDGTTLTGDQVLAICANGMKGADLLRNNRVVSTVMSNLGLSISLKRMGIDHLRTPVGDRHVVAEMRASGSVLGGEDSGHTVFLDHHTTGDGILTALQLAGFLQEASESLSQLSGIMTVFPQVLLNVRVASKPDLDTVPEIGEAIRAAESSLGEEGRVLVRYSGTEPLCRAMVEGPTQDVAREHCRHIAGVIEAEIGDM